MVSHHVVASAAASSSPTRRGASKRKLRISARPAMAAHTDSASSEDIENGTSGSDIAAAAAHQQEGAATPRPSSQQQLPSTHDAVSAANDRFLDEVEGELLSDSSGQTLLNGNSSNKARHHHQQQQQQTHYPSLLSNTKPSLPPSQYPYEEDIKAFPPHAYNPYYNQDVGTSSTTNMSIETNCGGDPSAFRRKMGIGIVYILVGTIYELIIYKLAQRTVWPNATLFVPLELSALTVAITILSLVLRRKKSGGNNAQLQHIFGLHSSTSLSTGWKEILPLAASVGAAATLRILKDSFLEPSISTSVSTFIAPTLLLILPSLLQTSEAPRNGFLVLAAVAIPTMYGVAMADMQVISSGVVAALGFVLVESTKLGLAKKWLTSKSTSPLETLVQYLPPAAFVTLLTLLPLSLFNGAPSHLPHLWGWYFLAHLVGSVLNQICTLMAINVFSSPLSVALLNVPKGLLITMFNGGVVQGHRGSSHEYMISCGVSMVIIVLAVPELRQVIFDDSSKTHSRQGSYHNYDLAPSTAHSHPTSPTQSRIVSNSSAVLSVRATRFLALTSFVPLIYWIISQGANTPFDYNKHLTNLKYYTHSRTVDIVISYYDEDPMSVVKLVNSLRYYPWIKNRDPRFILYMKNGQLNTSTTVDEFMQITGVDEVHDLKNRGREAGTYLRHILRNYNDSISPSLSQSYRPPGLADHTLFMQPHLAWDWIARERLWLFRDDTGYLHFAPYIKLDCGRDMDGNGDFPRLHEIYNIFRGELCPPTLQLGAYSSQFVVSKRRILANSYQKYKSLDDILEADADHWIHKEGTWWKYHGEPGPSNPYLGHAMERAWPTIFDCANPSLADTCAGDNYTVTGCQCFDP